MFVTCACILVGYRRVQGEQNSHYHFFVQARPCDNYDNDGHSNEASCDNDDGNDDNDGGRDGVRVLRLESSAWI